MNPFSHTFSFTNSIPPGLSAATERCRKATKSSAAGEQMSRCVAGTELECHHPASSSQGMPYASCAIAQGSLTICEVQRRPLQPDHIIPPRFRCVLLNACLVEVDGAVAAWHAHFAATPQALPCLLKQVCCTGRGKWPSMRELDSQ